MPPEKLGRDRCHAVYCRRLRRSVKAQGVTTLGVVARSAVALGVGALGVVVQGVGARGVVARSAGAQGVAARGVVARSAGAQGVAALGVGASGILPMTERIAVTGGGGTLGVALTPWLREATYLSHRECDVTQPTAVSRALDALNPDVVVHAAAITDHQHPNAAEIIETNILGTEYVARWCRASGARLVYCSTHYVYAGDAPEGGYREYDALRPIGAYAWSKLAGEHVAELVPNRLIVRGSWYTYETRIRHWLARAVLTDAWTSRESVAEAARKVAALVRGGIQGVVNIGGPRRTFAEIVRDEGYDAPGVRYRTRAELPAGPYPFPRDSSVNTDHFKAMRLL